MINDLDALEVPLHPVATCEVYEDDDLFRWRAYDTYGQMVCVGGLFRTVEDAARYAHRVFPRAEVEELL